jgi:hypothetical protein
MANDDDDPRNDPRFLRRAQAILAGEPYEERERGVAKTLNFVLAEAGADTWIASSIIKVHFVGRPTIHRYYVDAAPGVVWDLLGRMGVDRITAPTVGTFRLSGARLPLWPGRGARTDMIGWIVPGADGIAIHSRPAEGRLPVTGPIPDDGPLALPAPSPHWPPRPEQVQLCTLLACPHCGRQSTKYRKLLDGFFVCAVCSRSFDPAA